MALGHGSVALSSEYLSSAREQRINISDVNDSSVVIEKGSSTVEVHNIGTSLEIDNVIV